MSPHMEVQDYLNQYERLHTTPPTKTSWGFSENVLQHLAKPSCFQRRKHWAVPGQEKGRYNKAGRLKKNATKTSMQTLYQTNNNPIK